MPDSIENLDDREIVEKSRSQLGGGTHTYSGQLDPAYQVEMMRRLKDSIDRFNSVTSRFSVILIVLVIVQILIALVQLFETFN